MTDDVDLHPGATAQEKWVRGDWMQTYCGAAFYPLDPQPTDIEFVDIAHALSLICRYGGHAKRFYSVAEHCVLMSHWIEDNATPGDPEQARRLALWALVHDAAEAYLGDLIRPVKRLLPDYQAIERDVLGAILEKLGMWDGEGEQPETPTEVKEADNRILLTEREALLNRSLLSWNSALEAMSPLDVQIYGWDPKEAEQRYLARFLDLKKAI